MPGLDDWTLNPHKTVEKIFDECRVSGDWRQQAQDFFTQEVAQQHVLDKLPWLNETPLHRLRPSQVVRYRGMVQDMFDNEFFLDTYEVRDEKTGVTRLRPGRYKDIAECGSGEEILMDSPNCKTGDRMTYYCIPIPGENEWIKELSGLVNQERNPSLLEASTSSCSFRSKRCAGEEDEEFADSLNQSSGNKDQMETESVEDSGENKRLRTIVSSSSGQTAVESSSTVAPGAELLDLNFPIPNMKGTPCLVKVYEDQTFSLNDVVEMVGILSVDPALAPNNRGQQDATEFGCMDVEEETAHCPPPSLVPRLHVLTIRKMCHTNPLLPANPNESPDSVLSTTGDMREARELVRQVLEAAFLGDALTAELMICHLVSSVYLRQDVIALGKYCLNISGVSKTLQDQRYTSRLQELLASLVTQSHFLPMTLTNMNTANFIPRKDYKANRLLSGQLQLPQHTHLIVDETALTAGQLDTKGVQNLTALGNVINWQKVDYDFKFHQIEQHTNIPVIILSEGRSMIASDAEVRLSPSHTDVHLAFSKVESLLTLDALRRVRTYLTAARLLDYTLTDGMQKMVQDDFVESRKNDNGITAEDLHNLLVLSRLVAVSCGDKGLTKDVWRSSKILESERKQRLNVNNTQ